MEKGKSRALKGRQCEETREGERNKREIGMGRMRASEIKRGRASNKRAQGRGQGNRLFVCLSSPWCRSNTENGKKRIFFLEFLDCSTKS